jgi:hypothetical protein
MTDVFISYSTDDRTLAEKLAAFLQERGYSVWWDRELFAGQDFHDKIGRVIEECRVAIVIWTRSSIKSRWVLGEADIAAVSQKLIPTRADALKREQLPIAFRAIHTVALSDRDGLLEALKSRFDTPPKPLGFWELARMRAVRRARLLRQRLTWKRAAAAAILLGVIGYFGLTSLDWIRIRDSIEASDFRQHLEKFPFSPFASEATAKIAGVDEWESIKSSKLLAEIEAFVEKFPRSLHHQFARLRLSRLQAIASGRYKPLLPDSGRRALQREEIEPLTCDQLWLARNEIFYAVGYCFVTDLGIDRFRTAAECPYADCRRIQKNNASVSNEILSAVETRNIDAIKKLEETKGCVLPPAAGLCTRKP